MAGRFTFLSKLAYLNMAHNRIDLYSDKAFQEINGTLKALDLSNNEFQLCNEGYGTSLHIPSTLIIS